MLQLFRAGNDDGGSAVVRGPIALANITEETWPELMQQQHRERYNSGDVQELIHQTNIYQLCLLQLVNPQSAVIDLEQFWGFLVPTHHFNNTLLISEFLELFTNSSNFDAGRFNTIGRPNI